MKMDKLDLFKNNNLHNLKIDGTQLNLNSKQPCWVGIDEAGRGPVLGPMVYGICYSALEKRNRLKDMGFADSKTLSEEKRESMFKDLHSNPDDIGWMVEVLSPHYISTCMLRRIKYNLNQLSHDTAISLLQAVIEKGVNVAEVYVDTVGDPEKYQSKLEQIFPGINITVAKKADATYSICSAASICAKVARDHAVNDWNFREPINTATTDHGSGYPADPKTKEFLTQNVDKVFGFPKIVRFAWSTARKILEERAASVQWADDEEENTKPKKRKSAASFFDINKENRQKPFRYFSERKLTPCTSL